MKRLYKSLVVLAVVGGLLAFSSQYGNSQQTDTQKAFFKNLKNMCGQQFEGQTTFPLDAAHPMAGKKLVMFVESCRNHELRIPFQVGEDKSRTWILTLTEKGLLFKHDHRHADGTPDKITMYGGWADQDGTAYMQRFPADADTARLIPEAVTNVWTLQIVPEKQQFIYSLERHAKPRYQAVFNLKAGKAPIAILRHCAAPVSSAPLIPLQVPNRQ